MGFCSCLGAPKVKHENSDEAGHGHASSGKKRGKAEPVKANDSLAAPLLKSSKKGCESVLQAAKELSRTSSQWTSGNIDAATVRARASALSCCIDTLLAPLLDAVESAVGRPGKGGEAGWEGLQLKDIATMCHSASAPATSLPLQRIADGVAMLIQVLQELKEKVAGNAQLAAELRLSTAFHNQSTNKLVGMVSVILSRQVTHEAQSVWSERFEAWKVLATELLGLDLDRSLGALAVTLRPQSKALLVYLQGAAQRGERKVTFKVRRETALWDATSAMQQFDLAHQRTGAAKVFPQFRVDESGAVEAGEGHGPRKEFFLAAGDGMIKAPEGAGQDKQSPFSYSRSAGQYFFNQMLSETSQNCNLLWVAGWLAGQTICNRATLGVPLPELLFRFILEGESIKPTLAMLKEFDPDAANALKNVSRLAAADFEAMLQLEECEGMSRDEYIQHSVASALCLDGDMAWIYKNFKDGFWSSLNHEDLQSLRVSSEELMEMVCGAEAVQGGSSMQFSVQQVFRIVLDEELGGDGSGEEEAPAAPLAKALWEVVDTWPADTKRQFVVFVTGSDRLPLPGTELLRVELPFVALSARDHKKMLGMLPQAHTCENLLELPNYWEALMRTDHPEVSEASELTPKDSNRLYTKMTKVLDERLQLAITSCNSYGLDEGVGASDEPAAARGRLLSSVQTTSTSASGGAGAYQNLNRGLSIASSSSEGDAAQVVPYTLSRQSTISGSHQSSFRQEVPGGASQWSGLNIRPEPSPITSKPSATSVIDLEKTSTGTSHLVLGPAPLGHDKVAAPKEELGPLKPLRDRMSINRPAEPLLTAHNLLPPPHASSSASVLGGNMRQSKQYNSNQSGIPGLKNDNLDVLLFSPPPLMPMQQKSQQRPQIFNDQHYEIGLPGMMPDERAPILPYSRDPTFSNDSSVAGKHQNGILEHETLDDLMEELDLLR